jgi:hypothetical protein
MRHGWPQVQKPIRHPSIVRGALQGFHLIELPEQIAVCGKFSNDVQFANAFNLKLKLKVRINHSFAALPAICISAVCHWHAECKMNFMIVRNQRFNDHFKCPSSSVNLYFETNGVFTPLPLAPIMVIASSPERGRHRQLPSQE